MKCKGFLLATSLSFALSFTSITALVKGDVHAASRSFTFSESTSQTQTHTITLPNLKSINSISTNRGTASVQSINGDNATIQLTSGTPSRSVQTGGTAAGSVIRTDSQTNTSNSFANSIYYNAGGYTGTLYKSGSVSSYSVETGGYYQDTGYWQTDGYWEQTGYYQDSGYYREETQWTDPVWVCQTGANGSPTGYCDWEYSFRTVQVWVPQQIWVSTGQQWVTTGQYWVNTGQQWVPSYTTYYTQNYSGTVSKPDTRTYQHYYQYSITVDYVDNQAPTLSVVNTSQMTSAVNGYQLVTIQGTVRDVDNDNVTISATLNGKSKSTVISSTNVAKNWTLSWNVATDNIAQGTYSNIAVTANDGKGGIANSSYPGVIKVDRTAPSITFTPEMREIDFRDIEVQMEISDTGGSTYKQYRYIFSKEETYPTEGWSEWDTTINPIIKQEKGGKWYLHIEAMDALGNARYAMSGIYEKIVTSGPSVTINVLPTPTGTWMNKPIDVYIMESGDSELLAKAKKYYTVTNNALYPTEFNQIVPNDKKVQLNLQGENFIHVQYILEDGTKVSSTAGPYLIDTGIIGAFEMKLVNANGNEVLDWSKEPLRLVITDPSTTNISGMKKEYRIEGLHHDWQPFVEGMKINLEGEQRIFGRVVSGTGVASSQKMAISKFDQTKPTLLTLNLVKNVAGQYNVTAKVKDDLSQVKNVTLDDGTVLSLKNNVFEVKNLPTKPTHLSVSDHAGNNLTPISFAKEPIVTFNAPYTLDLEIYREDVIANLTSATGYIVGNKPSSCSSDPCQVTIGSNTTLIAVQTEGVKETRQEVKIDNIDQTTIPLVLNGKRNVVNPLQIQFNWNLSLTSGTLTCTNDDSSVDYAISNTSFTLDGRNHTYHCTLTGEYKGKTLTSNRVVIYADGKLPTEGTTKVPVSEVTTNVYIIEADIGKAYIINAISDNYKYSELPLPQNEITQD